jgi:hypothetical protein
MKREPNLFEAFQTASKKSEGGLAPPGETTAPVQPQGVWRGARGGGLAAASSSRLALVFGASIVLAFATGYLVGDARQAVHAKGGDGAEVPANSPVGNQPERPWFATGEDSGTNQKPTGEAKSTVSGVSGLYNSANLYTVLAITYTDVPSNQGLAKKISEYLREQGLPAFEPISNKGRIEILVGAAETQGALQDLTSRLRKTRGPSGNTFDFQSAYVDNIDNHVKRD